MFKNTLHFFNLENKLGNKQSYMLIYLTFKVNICTNVVFTLNMALCTMNIAVSYDKLH